MRGRLGLWRVGVVRGRKGKGTDVGRKSDLLEGEEIVKQDASGP